MNEGSSKKRKREKNTIIKINQKKMLTYYQQEFDPIEKKYERYLESKNKSDYDKCYRMCYQYEDNRQLSDLTKKEFGDIYANLRLVYENEELTEEIIEIYDLVYDKVINQYLNIDGLERLFSENYINFEWEMHLGIDYASHSMKFYRDHFIHQVRDAYCMDMLLKEGYLEKIKEVLGNDGNSKISKYVCKHVNQQLENGSDVFSVSNDVRKEFYLENIIFMSSYMSALFHDIGYPEVANIQSRRNILAYIANVYNFGSGHIDFDRIITVLQNSLLFRIVSPNEIRKRVEGDKIDHGAVSALMFLLHFYENGAVYGLEPYKKCAVELAGLAIYNHTNSYEYILEAKERENALYQRNVFALTPISYLLRICDDLQEWGRIYFEISSSANIIFCKKCYTPIVRRELGKEKDVYYLCNCNEKEDRENKQEKSGVFGTIFRRGSFPYRRLYNVTVCKELVLEKKKENKYIFKLDYDLERLLYVAYINPSYAKYRIKELNQLKKMFVRQDIKEMTYIDYFISANVLLIKAWIVGKYLECYRKEIKLTTRVNGIINYINQTLESDVLTKVEIHNKIKEKSSRTYERIHEFLEIGKLPEILKQYLDENFWLYIYFYFVIRIGMFANKLENQHQKTCDVIENLWTMFKDDSRYEEEAIFLIKDCCKQAVRLYDHNDICKYLHYPDKYFEQFKVDRGIEPYFFRFVQSDNYHPINQRSSVEVNKLDAYTDLYVFKVMLHKINERLSESKEILE